MNTFITFLQDKIKLLWRALHSRTVLSGVAGIAVWLAVRAGYLPDNLATQISEALFYILAVLFRVIATTDISGGGSLGAR